MARVGNGTLGCIPMGCRLTDQALLGGFKTCCEILLPHLWVAIRRWPPVRREEVTIVPGGLPARRDLFCVGTSNGRNYNLRTRRVPRSAGPTQLPQEGPAIDCPVQTLSQEGRGSHQVPQLVVNLVDDARRMRQRVACEVPERMPQLVVNLVNERYDMNEGVCPECGRCFKTKAGLSQHRRMTHPDEYNNEIVIGTRRRGWRIEELKLMATEEATAVNSGVKYINQHLHGIFMERTIDAIKGARKRGDYKLLLQEALASLEQDQSADEDIEEAAELTPATISNNDVLLTQIRELIALASDITSHHAPQLIRVAEEVVQGGEVSGGAAAWFRSVFPLAESRRSNFGGRRTSNDQARIPKWRLRRREYARMQSLYKRDQGRAAKVVLDGADSSAVLDYRTMFEYWEPVMTTPSLQGENREMFTSVPQLDVVWRPVAVDEVKATFPPLRAAAGPDGVSTRLWRAVPSILITLFFNIIMVNGGFPVDLLLARTVFVPKKNDARVAADFRPITIASVAVRHLHKILAKRLMDSGLIGESQRAMSDGCAENVALLATILEDARRRLREVHMASLDISKAFDSVSHGAIIASIQSKGLPKTFVDYISRYYRDSRTIMEVQPHKSPIINVTRGVRQGDPLSSLLFCMVIDRAIQKIPAEIGYEIGDVVVNSMAYADDVILMASTKSGLQKALHVLEEGLGPSGLRFNAEKCLALSMVPSGKLKKMKVVTTAQFVLGGAELPQVSPSQEWRYLGVDFRTTGVRRVGADLAPLLERLTKAPLKPQQRLQILRCYLLPRMYYRLVMAGSTMGVLRGLDKQVRLAVRKWLRLPHDVPVSYFHVTVADGGLGIPSFATAVPGFILSRFGTLSRSSSIAVRAVAELHWVDKRVQWATRVLTKDGRTLLTKEDREKWWAHRLYFSVDGYELREAYKTNLSTSWVRNASLGVPGRDFIQYHQVRINALPTRMRTSRGMRREGMDVMCRAGCLVAETAAHVVQSCHRTHGGRIKRHDAVSAAVAHGLKQLGWEVKVEPRIRTVQGLRKPDVVASKAGSVVVIDAQVVSGSSSIDEAHRRKTSYYRDNPDMARTISKECGVGSENIRFSSCTLSWKGIWSVESANFLLGLGLPRGLLAGITTRVLQGSSTNWNRWNKMTAYIPANRVDERVGVG